MTKRFRLKITRILSFRSCRSKDPSHLPFNPVPSVSLPQPPPPSPKPQRRRSSFVLAVIGCGSSTRRRSSTPFDLSPPQVNDGEYETPRRKVYNSGQEKTDLRRSSIKKERYSRRRGSTSSAEEYEEETERESLLLSSTNLSPEYSSSELPHVTRRRSQLPKRKSAATSVAEEESEPLSPARLSSFVQRLMPCTPATAAAAVVEGVAVVKKSEDPYEDFKGSMVEMIVEKKMFQVAELEQLLRCFLTLNAKRHHRAIVKAFSEVWVALFSGGNDTSSRRSSVRLSDYDECLNY